MRPQHAQPPAAAPSCGPIRCEAGIGLRFAHHRQFLEAKPKTGWVEVHSENYMGGGAPVAVLEAVRRDYPVSLHGVGLSLGSAEGISFEHLARLKALADRIAPCFVSEHLSFSIAGGSYLADLLPLPLTEEALAIASRHVEQMQVTLGRRVLIENPSSYLTYRHSTIPEWEFIAELAARTGCGILCDVNNIFVSACNHGWDAPAYLAALPTEAVGEIHLAGHRLHILRDGSTLRIDDHGSPVAETVWRLYAEALALFGPVPTLIEWDNDLPDLAVLLDEAAKAQRILDAESGRRSDAHAA
ncbi:MAG: DUF692 domain-containing protein [Pseudomonadota bacterium]|nr:DUF692 domain-containing protein [Pseudomonadota bacterium]